MFLELSKSKYSRGILLFFPENTNKKFSLSEKVNILQNVEKFRQNENWHQYFSLYLAMIEKTEQDTPKGSSRPGSTRNRNVVIVDDEPEQAQKSGCCGGGGGGGGS